jgi:hypothetical protein
MTDVSDTRSTLPDEPPAEGADQPTNERKSKAGTTVTSTNTVPDGTLDEPDMERAGVWRLALVVAALVALWWWQGWALVVVILALLFMITMHELGHYLMAKRAGMKVTQFFIGLGPGSGRPNEARPSTASEPSPPVLSSRCQACCATRRCRPRTRPAPTARLPSRIGWRWHRPVRPCTF